MPAAQDLSKYLLEHNICWIDDPDHLVLSKSDYATSRSWVTLVGLTGTLLTFSDRPERLSDAKVDMLRRILPAIETSPLELYEIDSPPTLWTLEMGRPFGNWLIVANTSFGSTPKTDISFSELGLEANKKYTVYDFWDQQFMGIFEGKFDCPALAAHDVQVYAIHEKKPYPWVVSINRHISQGGVSSLDLDYEQQTNILSGKSRVVGNDPYRITIYCPEHFVYDQVTVSTGSYAIRKYPDNVLELIITIPQNVELQWQITFIAGSSGGLSPRNGLSADVEYCSTSSNVAIKLRWNNVDRATHYQLYRSTEKSDAHISLADQLTSCPYIDSTVSFGYVYCYTVKAIRQSDKSRFGDTLAVDLIRNTPTSIKHGYHPMPVKYLLDQNYPNPFNRGTIIHYYLPEKADVRLRIYNVLGRLVRTLVNDMELAGNHSLLREGKGDLGMTVG